jgi:ferric-dicitrate binding protein FerR (iron transport regulator)
MMRKLGNRSRLQQLLKKYVQKKGSEKQQDFVQWYYQSFESDPDYLAGKSSDEKEQIRARVLNRMKAQLQMEGAAPQESSPLRTVKVFGWAAGIAAAAVLAVGVVYFYNDQATRAPEVVKSHMPAIEKAIVTAQDGTVHAIAGQGGNDQKRIVKDLATNTAKFDFISIEIPNGCKYHFNLEDGTEVWLNPGSKMHIPLDYGKTNRTVSLWGEAYFIVHHMDKLPFHVQTEGLDIRDIGTEFKVRAYAEQKTTVTLAKGSVVVYDSVTQKHFPLDDMGEQIQVDPVSKKTTLVTVDTAFATCIKNNLFYFDHASIDQVTQEISKWYDITFKLEGYFNDLSFTGSIRRDSQLKDVLKILELSNLNYTMQGDVVVLAPGKFARVAH